MHNRMQRMVLSLVVALALLLATTIGVGADAPTITVGNSSPWGAWVWYHTAPDVITNPLVRVVWATGDTSATIYCGVTSGPHYPPTISDSAAWVPAYNVSPPNTDYTVLCATRDVLCVTGSQPQLTNCYMVPQQSPPPR